MLAFPQLGSGATGQYPVKKHCIQRAIVNQLPDGRAVKLADSGAELLQWQMNFQDLGDAEMTVLQQFFSACEGQLNVFTFLDPVGNLLAWSEALNQPVWAASTLLQMSMGISDPNGGTGATRLTNPTGSDLTLQQAINAPGWFTYCFSFYVHTQSTADFWILRQAGAASDTRSFQAGPIWRRISSGGSLSTTAQAFSAGVVIPAGQSLDVFGFQLEPQPAPSPYKPSYSASGVYANAHFSEDTFAVTTPGPNRNACTLTITAH
jgi:hypothetical protein